MTFQNQPIEDSHDDATTEAKVAGIVEQMRHDVAQGNVSDVADALRQRFVDSRITVTDDRFDEIVTEIS